jgi:hypothetical protein
MKKKEDSFEVGRKLLRLEEYVAKDALAAQAGSSSAGVHIRRR